MFCHEIHVLWLIIVGDGPDRDRLPLLNLSSCLSKLIHMINFHFSLALTFNSQLSAMDASVRTTMKGAAKCDKHCKLQDSENQQDLERILRFRDMPGSMPTSASPRIHVLGFILRASLCISAPSLRASVPLMHQAHWCDSSKEQIEHFSCAFLFLVSASCSKQPLRGVLPMLDMKLGQKTR